MAHDRGYEVRWRGLDEWSRESYRRGRLKFLYRRLCVELIDPTVATGMHVDVLFFTFVVASFLRQAVANEVAFHFTPLSI